MHQLESRGTTPKVASRFGRETQPSGGIAAGFRRRRLRDPRAVGLNIVPMVDVTFLLMIFFVIAGTFEMFEGVLGSRLLSVGGRHEGQSLLPISPVVVRLTQPPDNPQGCRILIERFGVEPADFDELTSHLRQIQGNPGFDRETPVIILADEAVLWDHVVNCWNAAVRAAYINITFGA